MGVGHHPVAFGFDVQVGSAPASHSVSNRDPPWIAVSRSSPVAGVREAVGLAGRADHDVAALDDDRRLADLERRLARLDDEHLGVRVAMELRPDARPRVDEDHRERHVAVLGADELVGVLGVLERLEIDDGSHWPSVAGRESSATALGRARSRVRRSRRASGSVPASGRAWAAASGRGGTRLGRRLGRRLVGSWWATPSAGPIGRAWRRRGGGDGRGGRAWGRSWRRARSAAADAGARDAAGRLGHAVLVAAGSRQSSCRAPPPAPGCPRCPAAGSTAPVVAGSDERMGDDRPIRLAAPDPAGDVRERGTRSRGTFVTTVLPRACISPIGSRRKPPPLTRSRMPDRTSCWRAARVKSLSPAALRTRANASACWPFRWCRPAVIEKPREKPYSS